MWDVDDVYKEHVELIYKYLFSLSLDAYTAEELTQETFYRAILSKERYNGSCKISTWLCQIAKHLWYQELDKNRRRKTEQLDDSLPDYKRPIELEMSDQQGKMLIYHKLHNLTDPTKEIMYLRLSGELSFREIGEIFKQSETWARVTFYRGKKKLMEVLE